MPPHDPELTARNNIIDGMTQQLRTMLPSVLADTDIEKEQSLPALYGGKFADYIDIKNAVIHSPDHFIALYLDGFKKLAEERPASAHGRNFRFLKPVFYTLPKRSVDNQRLTTIKKSLALHF